MTKKQGLKRKRAEEKAARAEAAVKRPTGAEPRAPTRDPLLPRDLEERKKGQRVFVVLEKAPLELVHVKGHYELMNVDDHKNLIAKSGKDVSSYRPDITHQSLMALLDSPLNKAGKLWVYIHTANNVLIEVHPSIRIPRTYKRFCGLMVELLQRNKIKAANSNVALMRVISNPVTKYLPENGRKIGFSVAGRLTDFRKYVHEEIREEVAETDRPITFVVGAVAHDDPVTEDRFGGDYVDDKLSISNWGLSAACCCAKICNEFEALWNVL